jgi:hypothetical protein
VFQSTFGHFPVLSLSFPVLRVTALVSAPPPSPLAALPAGVSGGEEAVNNSSIGVVVPCVGSGVMPRGGWPPAPTSGGDGVLDGGMGVEPRAAPRV